MTRSRAVVALLTLGLLAAACGGDDDDASVVDTGAQPTATTAAAASETTAAGSTETTAAGSSATTAAAAPETTAVDASKYDTDATVVTTTQGNGPVTFDPHLVAGANNNLDEPVLDGLVTFDRNSAIVPMLAESWDVSPDGLAITFHLRDGVKFHDGTPFTSEAVVKTYQRAMTLEGSVRTADFVDVKSIEAVDDLNVRINLTRPSAGLIGQLATATGYIMNPKMLDDPDAVAKGAFGIGTGPYQLVSYEGNTHAVYQRVDGYWDKEVAARIPKQFEWVTVTDPGARLAGVQTGEYQTSTTGGMADLAQELADSSDQFDVTVRTGSLMHVFMFNMYDPPFDKPEVRQAVRLIIDWREVMDTSLANACTLGSQVFNDSHWAYDSSIQLPEQNLEKAHELLASVGLGDGFEFKALTAPPGADTETAAIIFQEQLKKAGITMDLETIPYGPDVADKFINRQVNAFIQAFFPVPDPNGTLVSNLKRFHFGEEGVPRADEVWSLIDQANSTYDQDERAQLYHQISKIFDEDVWFVPYCHRKTGELHDVRLEGAERNKYGVTTGWDPRAIGWLKEAPST
jgi:peptide/nickel transport system substrate-binding protein